MIPRLLRITTNTLRPEKIGLVGHLRKQSNPSKKPVRPVKSPRTRVPPQVQARMANQMILRKAPCRSPILQVRCHRDFKPPLI
jgi:hypothetical protein